MNQFSYEDVLKMSYAELGAIDDPMELTTTGSISPMLVRYAVRTGQLSRRYGDVPLAELMDAIQRAAAIHRYWPAAVSQKAPIALRDKDVDAYLDSLDALPSLKELKERPADR